MLCICFIANCAEWKLETGNQFFTIFDKRQTKSLFNYNELKIARNMTQKARYDGILLTVTRTTLLVGHL